MSADEIRKLMTVIENSSKVSLNESVSRVRKMKPKKAELEEHGDMVVSAVGGAIGLAAVVRAGWSLIKSFIGHGYGSRGPGELEEDIDVHGPESERVNQIADRVTDQLTDRLMADSRIPKEARPLVREIMKVGIEAFLQEKSDEEIMKLMDECEAAKEFVSRYNIEMNFHLEETFKFQVAKLSNNPKYSPEDRATFRLLEQMMSESALVDAANLVMIAFVIACGGLIVYFRNKPPLNEYANSGMMEADAAVASIKQFWSACATRIGYKGQMPSDDQLHALVNRFNELLAAGSGLDEAVEQIVTEYVRQHRSEELIIPKELAQQAGIEAETKPLMEGAEDLHSAINFWRMVGGAGFALVLGISAIISLINFLANSVGNLFKGRRK